MSKPGKPSAATPPNFRAACVKALLGVLDGASLDDTRVQALSGQPSRLQPLGRELLDGTVRWYFQLSWQLEQMLPRRLPNKYRSVQALLLLGLYQLQHMQTPAHLVVDESVDACKKMGERHHAGLVNAVLRRIARSKDLPDLKTAPRHVRLASPPWLLAAIQRDWPQSWETILNACNQRAPLALRVNQRQGSRDQYLAEQTIPGCELQPVDGVPAALLVSPPVATELIPGFADGRISVQDLSAQVAANLLPLTPGLRVLDACAAPGGKSGHLLELCPDIALDCLEISPSRTENLQATLQRLGIQARILTGDASQPEDWWDQQPYDRILLDAPCSGSGVIRRHPDIRLLRRESDIARLAVQQLGILEALWKLIRPAGMLLYVTCSLLREENEAVIAKLLDSRPGAAVMPITVPGGTPCKFGQQIILGDTPGDGFYFCLLQRSEHP